MKNNLFFSGMIGILLIFAIFAGCDNGTTKQEVVVVTKDGPVHTFPGPQQTHEVPKEGSTYTEVAKKLLEAEEAYAADPDTAQVVVIKGQIPIQGNKSLIVPDHVTLQIDTGGRLTVEANAMLYVREFGKVLVVGELYFEKNANADDVRQAKLVGDIDVDGGVIYDKSDDGHLLQYVNKIMNGGRLVYSGGTGIEGAHEKFFLGTSTFNSVDGGYVKLVFSDGWSKYNPVVITGAAYSLLNQPIAAANPVRLVGFEVIGKVELTGGEMVLPDSVNSITAPDNTTSSTNPLTFVVKRGSTLTIGASASLSAESAYPMWATQLVVEEGGKVDVSGKLGLPVVSTATNAVKNKNLGTITINDTGTLFIDTPITAGVLATIADINQGTILVNGGGKILANRANLPVPTVYLSAGNAAEDIQTSGKTVLSIKPDLISFGGDSKDKSSYILKKVFEVGPHMNIEVNNAGVTAKDTLNGDASTSTVSLTVRGRGKLTLEKSAGGGSNKFIQLLVTGTGSELVVEKTGVVFTNAPAVLADNGTAYFAASYFPVAATGTAFGTDIKSNQGIIGFRGNILALTTATQADITALFTNNSLVFEDPVVFNKAFLTMSNTKAVFRKGLALHSRSADTDTTPTNTTGAAVTVSNSSVLEVSGELSLALGDLTLAGGSKAILDSAKINPKTAAVSLTAASDVTLAGTLEFAAAATITVGDGASTFTGTVPGTSKVTGPLTGGGAIITLTVPAGNEIGFPGIVGPSSTIPALDIATWAVVDGKGKWVISTP